MPLVGRLYGYAQQPVTFLGIDPGLGGGLALLCGREPVRCCPTPADNMTDKSRPAESKMRCRVDYGLYNDGCRYRCRQRVKGIAAMTDAEYWAAFTGVATLVGSIATAVGLIVSAVSLYYAWGQLSQARREAKDTAILTTAGILIEYYSDKISSLNDAIGEGRNVAQNTTDRNVYIRKHKEVLALLETTHQMFLSSTPK
jgi:hypothetical protein